MIQGNSFQFLRAAAVTFEQRDIARFFEGQSERSLSINFKVVKSVKLEPNTTEITVVNLSQRSRDFLSQQVAYAESLSFEERQVKKAGQVEVYAGYGSVEASLISRADVKMVSHKRESSGDWTTTIEAVDGRVPWNNSFASETLAAGGADLNTVKSTLAALAKINQGVQLEQAFQQALPNYQVKKGNNGFKNGYVVFGPIRDRFDNLFEQMGLRAWIHNGTLVVTPRNLPIPGVAVSLKLGDTLKSFTRTKDGFYQFSSLLDARIEPGRQIQLQDADNKPLLGGVFRCDQCELIGETLGNAWSSSGILRPSGSMN